jgi:DinB superfamily
MMKAKTNEVSAVPVNHSNLIINELIDLLNGGNAHASFDEAIKDISFDLLGSVPHGLPYSLWQLVEHIRIAQWDIVEFSRNPHHKSPKWPDEYWPKEKAPVDAKAWKKSLVRISSDREAFIGLLQKAGSSGAKSPGPESPDTGSNDAAGDLFTPFPHGDGQTLLREALLIADHTSYHTGEIILLRRLLGVWK